MYKFLKRSIDIFISFVGLIILWPFFIIIAVLIKIDSKGPVFFKQERIGKYGKVFKIWKFRSMKIDAEKQGVYEKKNDTRVTRIGKIIRKFSIDELPQFINILKGDMSLIGPRPTLTYHPWKYEEYSDYQKKRFNVRPGVTGWAQVNGRKNVDWIERIKFDIYYVRRMSIFLDIKIFFKTIINILFSRDNYNENSNTAKSNNKNLKLMYIANDEKIVLAAEKAGVDWIFIDLELIGKEERQGHLDTVISKHDISDVKRIKKVLTKSKLLVRINPVHKNTKNEINKVIKDGAEIIMLPYFKTLFEVQTFLKFVNGRVRTCLLLETPEAVNEIDSILELDGIDYIHIGLNDLHLEYKKKFMFELLTDGTVEKICTKIAAKGIEYGFGGIAKIGEGILPAEMIIAEHYRLKSTMAILSRSFFNKNKDNINDVEKVFSVGVSKIRTVELEILNKDSNYFLYNKMLVKDIVDRIVNER